jgi:hypothetical protein
MIVPLWYVHKIEASIILNTGKNNVKCLVQKDCVTKNKREVCVKQ